MEKADEILRKNLSWLSIEENRLSQERSLLVEQYLASQIRSDALFSENAKRMRDIYQRLFQDHPHEKTLSVISDRVNFAAFLGKHYFWQDAITPLLPITGKEKVAYWASNRHSHLAFKKMSSLGFQWASVLTESFVDVCELVNSDACDFGILPIENSTDGRLVGFYKMLDRYELKICMVCDIEDEKGENFTSLALVSKCIRYMENSLPGCIELSSISSYSEKVLEVISVAKYLGMGINRLSSIPLYYRKDAFVDTVTIGLTSDTITTFLAYLTIFEKDITVTGLYYQI